MSHRVRPPSPFLPAAASGSEPFAVPARFSMLSMLGLTTLFSIVFTFCHWLDAPPFMYLYFGCMAVVVGVAQMRFGGAPRAVSALAGAAFLPLFSGLYELATPYFDPENANPGRPFFLTLDLMPLLVIAGAIAGYLTGAVVAGVFLLADRWTEYVTPSAPVTEPLNAEVLDRDSGA